MPTLTNTASHANKNEDERNTATTPQKSTFGLDSGVIPGQTTYDVADVTAIAIRRCSDV